MSSSDKTIAEIQALRAIAVLLVVLYHGGVSSFSGGYIGVDVFFVISGYLITGLIFRENAENGEIDLLRFYARRIRRLFPAATVTVIAVCSFCWFFYSPLEFKQLTSSAIATTVYLSNFWFFQLATEYLAAEAHTNPLLHTWSLSVEEQFYLFWPLLIVGLTKLCRSSDVTGRLMFGLGAVSVVSFVFCVLHTESNQPLAFFGTHARAWEFGIGGLVALAHVQGLAPARAFRGPISLFGLLLIFGSAFSYSDRTAFPGIAALWPVSGTALVIYSSGGARYLDFWMKLNPVRYIGDISYSFYLWHWPVAVVLQEYATELGLLWLPVYIGISLLLASLSYHVVENPFRFSGLFKSKAAYSYYFGIVTSVLILCAIGAARMATEIELEKGSQVAYRNAATDMAVIYNDGCHLNQFETSVSVDCVYGPREALRSVVLFGDSHAANWFPALERLAFEQGFKLYSFTKSACPSIFFEPFNRMLNRQYTECTQWRENVLQFITDRKPDLLILSNFDGHFLATDGQRQHRVEIENLLPAISDTAQWLDEAGIPFVLIRDIPRVTFDPLNCLSRAAWKGANSVETCSFPVENEANKRIFDLYVSGFAGTDLGVFLDINDQICVRESACVLERDGLILYRDGNHITASFSRSLAPFLMPNLTYIGAM